MFKSYFLVALRNISRNWLHASINIIGLAIGMACCIIITLFVQFELGYDKQNRNYERIYRATVDLEANNWAISAFPLGQFVKDNFAEVENFTRIKPTREYLQNDINKVKNKELIFYADASVFDLLDIHLLKGDRATALKEINSMVITEDRARTYFGTEDPIGKTLTVAGDKKSYKVTGIFEPLPSNSHAHIDVMVSSLNFDPMKPDADRHWGSYTNHYTYFLLPAGIDYKSFEKKISAALDKDQKVTADQRHNVVHLQPLASIHLNSNLGLEIEPNGNMNTVYILSAIAVFILIIACINFMNLTTAQSLRRSREVGIRKVVGSKKSQLVVQFLSESVVISCIALILSVLIVTGVIPLFNQLSGKHIILNPLENGAVILFFAGVTFFVGVLAGTYPAFFLSAFKPVSVLKGNFAGNLKGQLLRKSLVVIQFAIAFVIMVGTYVVYDQLDFMIHKNMGFDREQTLIVRLPNDTTSEFVLKQKMLTLSPVQNVTRMIEVPGEMVRTTGMWFEGSPENKNANVYMFSGDADLISTMNMRMVTGHYFNPDSKRFGKEFVVNETAVKRFGWTNENAIGKLMEYGERGTDPGKVIGVVKDFNFKDLHVTIDPLVMDYESSFRGHYMAIKVKSQNLSQSLNEIEKTWRATVPQEEFEYKFLDESFGKLFQEEKRLGQVFSLFSGLAIFISCLGLFGLASFTLEQSKKSVAIRKVMGASVSGIVMMMSKDFLKLVFVGMIIAAPIAWFIMSRWLQGFAYNAGFGWMVFLYAAVAGMVVAFFTVSYHSLKAATANPVTSLKGQ